MAISSPTKGCGKTLLLDVISVFVEKPFDSATVTPAAIFRTIEAAHPTMLLDEADRWMKQDATGEKVAILNAGHRRGGSATRCVGEDYEPRRFRVDSPRAIAGIGDFLPDTLADRSITITLERKPGDVRLESFRVDRRPAPELRGQLKRWSEDCGAAFAAGEPNMGGMVNREADNWRQIFGVADPACRPPRRRSAGTLESSADPAARPRRTGPPKCEGFAYGSNTITGLFLVV